MTPFKFPESNVTFRPPPDLEESQCRSIPAYMGEVKSGSVEGTRIIVVCYELSEEDIARIIRDRKIFLSMLGGLSPHFMSFSFQEAERPA